MINREDLCINGLIQILNENPKLFKEIENLDKPFASGASTIAFKKDENTVLCLSLDYNKVLYLKRTPYIKNFNFIRFETFLSEFGTQIVMIYEMEYLRDFDYEFNFDELNLLDGFDQIEQDIYLSEESEYILDEVQALVDIDLIYSLQNLKHTPDFKFDLHSGQFLLDSSNSIICIDPIISSNIYI